MGGGEDICQHQTLLEEFFKTYLIKDLSFHTAS